MAEEEVQALKTNLSALQKALGEVLTKGLEEIKKQTESVPIITGVMRELSSLIGLEETPKIDIKSVESVLSGLQEVTDKTLGVETKQLKIGEFLFSKVDILSSVKAVSQVLEILKKGTHVQISPTHD